MIACFVSNKFNTIFELQALLQTVAICFCFAIMTLIPYFSNLCWQKAVTMQ